MTPRRVDTLPYQTRGSTGRPDEPSLSHTAWPSPGGFKFQLIFNLLS